MSSIRNLKLEVILSAIDKATRPIKAVMGSSTGLSRQLKETKDRLKELNKAQESITGFRTLTKGAKETGEKLAAARQKLKELNEQMAAAGPPTVAMTRKLKSAEIAVEKLTLANRKKIEAAKAAKSALEANGVSVAQLGAHERALASTIDATSAAMQRQQTKLAKLSEIQNRQRNARSQYEQRLEIRDRIAGAGASTTAAGSAVGLPIVKMIRDYASYEDAMLGIARQVDGARDANGKLTATYYQMGDAIKAMSEKVPMATTQIAALVEGGARMGIQGKENLLAFAKTAALASTAFDLPAEQISEDLGKIANTYKIPIKNIQQLGDVINYLDDNAQSKGADIINVMQRIAGNTGSMNFKEAAALGSTFLSLGASAEIAATATKAMVRELQMADKQPARFKKGLKELGLDAKQLQADMTRDSTGTIMKVMAAVNRLPKAKQMGVMVDLFGKEYGDDAAKLADNLGEYRKQLELVNSDKAKGSMQREGDAKNDTLSAQWQMLQNKLFNQSSELGRTLRQPLMDIMQAAGGVIDRISAWTKANPALTATLVKAGAATALLMASIGSLLLLIAGILGPMIAFRFALSMLGIRLGSLLPNIGAARTALARLPPLFITGTAGSKAYATTIASRLSPLLGVLAGRAKTLAMSNWGFGIPIKLANLLGRGIAGLLPLLSGIAQLGSGVMQALLGPLRVLGLLTRLVPLLGSAIAATPIGWLIGTLTAGALLIYKFWGPLKGFVTGFVSGLAQGLGSVLVPAFSALWGMLGKLWNQLKTLGGYLLQLLPFLTPIGAALTLAFTPVKALLGWLWNGLLSLMKPMQDTGNAAQSMGQRIGAVVGQIIGWVASLPVRMTELGVFMVQGLIGGINKMLGALKSSVTSLADSVVKQFKEMLGIHSPSRVFAELGGFTMAGLHQGIQDGQDGPLAAVISLAKKLTAAGAGIALSTASGMASAITMDTRPPITVSRPAAQPSAPDNITFQIYQAAGQSPQELARVIEQMMDARERRKAAAGRSRLTDRD